MLAIIRLAGKGHSVLAIGQGLIAWTEEISARPEFCLEESEALTFTSQVLGLPSLDQRSAGNLEQCAASHSNPMERERALWEFC
jgi:hypothetical protein